MVVVREVVSPKYLVLSLEVVMKGADFVHKELPIEQGKVMLGKKRGEMHLLVHARHFLNIF